ncbi:MAG TPA: hypothetical protein VE641_14870, partial [Chthoniobacterales bacterium]|nr:hypothetical protein [Chthoniobacterales bacterium]
MRCRGYKDFAPTELRIAESQLHRTGGWAVHRSPFTVHRSPFTVHRSPFTVHRSPFTPYPPPH